ncbi:hypothetical protein [Flavobacterium humi]|uniref:Uncharacterized protein n=1 Tax=Flavobacterium humi TaxID=2562683 RepID=A0A4Z0L6W5_9FLAO|nr:hypothetical protein [Flavobacterium humi]TGD57306.1 hypothetical protein E4635_11840 [Flavobacterium humi]
MKSLLILFIFSTLSVTAQKTENAQKIFLENLAVLEKVSNDENESIDLNTLYEARSFLLKTTGIKYELEKDFDMPIFPPKEILKAWRDWYDKNSDKLYWDKKTKSVKARQG